MSNPGTPAIPSFTGNPVTDAVVREALKYAAGLISAAIVAYMAKKGIANDTFIAAVPNYVLEGLTLLVMAGLAVWSVRSKKQTVTALVEHTTAAAQTGIVPSSVAAVATPAQKVVIAAVNAEQPLTEALRAAGGKP